MKLRVCTYNVWFMPNLVTGLVSSISPNKQHRVRMIAKALLNGKELDVLVLCEAFCAETVDLLFALMQHELPHRTLVLGARHPAVVTCKHGLKLLNGGVCIFSRFPFAQPPKQHIFPAAAREDALASKGVVVCMIQCADNCVAHVFATHLQAWDSPTCARAREMQLECLREIISCSTSPADLVLVCGDFNVSKANTQEYGKMLAMLNCFDCGVEDDNGPSFNHVENHLAMGGPSSSGKSEMLDYVLVSKAHLQPQAAHSHVAKLKSHTPFTLNHHLVYDLSDHFPVFASIEF